MYYHFIKFTSSTSIESLLLKNAMIRARPTAASAAAMEHHSETLGSSLAAMADTIDTDDPNEDEQTRRDEAEIKMAVTEVEIPEGGQLQFGSAI